MRKSKVKILAGILGLVSLILIASIIIIVVGKKTVDNYRQTIDDMGAEMKANQKTVYVASVDINAGEELVEDVNIFRQKIYTGLDNSAYMSIEDTGAISRLSVKAGEPIMSNAITFLELTKDTREYEMAVANLMTNQKDNEYVDVRIMFPNGEDYLVLAKKQIKNLNLENCVFYTYLNEDEILRMASATIDAYTVTGTRIYTTRYVEDTLQEEAIPNYVVKAETLDLISSDPNITEIATETLNLQARMDLENRMSALTEEQLKAVASGHELEDTAKNSVMFNGQYEVTEDEYDDDLTEYMDEEESEEETETSSDTSAKNTTVTPSPAVKDVIE